MAARHRPGRGVIEAMANRRRIGVGMAAGGLIVGVILVTMNNYYCSGFLRFFYGRCDYLPIGIIVSFAVAIGGGALAALSPPVTEPSKDSKERAPAQPLATGLQVAIAGAIMFVVAILFSGNACPNLFGVGDPSACFLFGLMELVALLVAIGGGIFALDGLKKKKST